MMNSKKLSKNVYQQLDGISIEKIERALIRDGYRKENMTFYHDNPSKQDVVLHFHPGKTYSANFIRDYFMPLTNWDIEDLKRLKLIKKK